MNDAHLGRRSPSVSDHRHGSAAQTGPSARREEWPKLAGTLLSHGGKSRRRVGGRGGGSHATPAPPVAAPAISW